MGLQLPERVRKVGVWALAAPALLALSAEIVLRSAAGTRTVPADSFFQGPFQTDARHDD